MLDLCATSRHRIVNATWESDDQWGVDACYEGRLVEGALKPTWEVKRLWVMHMGDVEERFEITWRDTFPGLWRVSVGSGVSCMVCRTLWEVKTLRLSENASVDLVTCTLRMSVFTPDE